MTEAENNLDYQFLFSSSNILCIGGMDGLVKLINPRFTEVTGWTEEDLLGKSFLDLMHPDDLEQTKSAMLTTPETITPAHSETKLRCKDGSYRWLSWNTTKKGNLFYCLATDITKQKHKEEEIQKNKQSQIDYQKILECVFDQIVITDIEGIILFVNGAVEETTGYSKSELLGSKAGKHWGGNMGGNFYEHLWTTIKGEKKQFTGKLTNKRKNGEMYDAEVRITPVLTHDNQIQYFVGVERDISKENELKKLTQMAVSREIRMSEIKEEMKKMKDNL